MSALKRLEFLDVSKGIGILLVVFGHVQRGLNDSHLLTKSYPFETIDFFIYSFHMPLFFFLSGLHVWKSMRKGSSTFLHAKLIDILLPYFVWSLIQGGVQVLMAGSTNGTLRVSDFPRIFYNPIGQFWFLYALFIWMMLSLLLQKHRIVLLAISFVGFVLANTDYISGFVNETCHMGFFFVLGSFALDTLAKYRLTISRAPVAIASVAIFVGTVLLMRLSDNAALWLGLFGALFGIAMVLSVSSFFVENRLAKNLSSLGNLSLPIYLMHILAIGAVRIVMLRLGFHSDLSLITFEFIAGVGFPILAYRVYRSALAVNPFIVASK